MVTNIARCNVNGKQMYGLTVNDRFCGFFDTVQDAVLWAPTYESLYQPFPFRSQDREHSKQDQDAR